MGVSRDSSREGMVANSILSLIFEMQISYVVGCEDARMERRGICLPYLVSVDEEHNKS